MAFTIGYRLTLCYHCGMPFAILFPFLMSSDLFVRPQCLAGVNFRFDFLMGKLSNLRIKQVKKQRTVYRDSHREMTKQEYMRLLQAALTAGNIRLCF